MTSVGIAFALVNRQGHTDFVTFPPIVGATEIADMLGVSRQRIQQLAGRPDFPVPVAVLKMGKIWLLADVEAWIERRGGHA